MARYTGPKSKIARRFGEPISVPIKYFLKRITHPDNMETHVEEKPQSMVFNYVKNKEQNIHMVFLKNNSAVFLTKHHAVVVLQVKFYCNY